MNPVPYTRAIPATLAAALLATAAAHAEITGPYSLDPNTLHLWHLDEADPGPAAPAAGLTGSFNLAADGGKSATPATLGASAYAGFGTAGDTTAGSGAGFKGAAIPASGATGADGAFTFEALVSIPTIADLQMVLSMEGNTNNTQRPFQFRIGGGDLLFINISAALAASGSTQNLNAAIPTSGPDAFVAGEWFHVAATYTGNEATADNFKLYWTRVDPARTEANEILSASMTHDLAGTTPAFGVGNDYVRTGTSVTNKPTTWVTLGDLLIGLGRRKLAFPTLGVGRRPEPSVGSVFKAAQLHVCVANMYQAGGFVPVQCHMHTAEGFANIAVAPVQGDEARCSHLHGLHPG
jgi:hypothetical protein